MPLPFTALRAGILIPVRSAQEVWPAVSVHVDGGDSFGVIRSQSMHEKSHLRHISRSVAANFIELCVGEGGENGQQRPS